MSYWCVFHTTQVDSMFYNMNTPEMHAIIQKLQANLKEEYFI
jgi:hypothetical protein